MKQRCSGRISPVLMFLAALALCPPLYARTLYVSPSGDDNSLPRHGAFYKSLAAAVHYLEPGDTLYVSNGNYTGGVVIGIRARQDAPVVIRGESLDAVIDGSGRERDALIVQNAAWVRIERLTARNARRAGCTVRFSSNITISGCRFADNEVWGIFTSFADDIRFENNECRGSKRQHGIYHSNSGDNFVIRGNRVHDNSGNGIHLNGDPEIHGGDGILNRGLVEGNVVWNNGRAGGAGINMTHVQDVIVRNNLIYNNLAAGITVYQDAGSFGQGSKNVLITGNTVFFRKDEGRCGVNVQTTSEKVAIVGNIFVSGGRRGNIQINARNLGSVFSDCNLLWGVDSSQTIERHDRRFSLDEWGILTGNDHHSAIAYPYFVAPGSGDFAISPHSPAVGLGMAQTDIIATLRRMDGFEWVLSRLEGLPPMDLKGAERPRDKAPDAGAFQHGE